MINKTSARVATNLATNLVDKDVRVVPKAGTLLSTLTSSIRGNLYTETLSVENIPEAIELAAAGSVTKEVYSASEHDTLMDNQVEDIARLVSTYISMTRGVINPLVTDFTERLSGELASHKHKEAEEFFNVSYFRPHSLFTSFVITSEVLPYQGASAVRVKDRLNLEKVRSEEFDLLSYVLTGDKAQDDEIRNWFPGVADKVTNYLVDNIPEYVLSIEDLLTCGMINYLFYRNLAEKTDINTGDSLTELRGKAANNRDYFGKQLSDAIGFYERAISKGKLFCSVSEGRFSYMGSDSVSVTLYEETFEKFAEEGGNIDVIFGHLATNTKDTYITTDQLLKDADFFRDKWTATRNTYLMYLNNSKLVSFKRLLANVVDATITGEVDNEDMTKYIASDSGYLDKTRELSYAYIDSLDTCDMDDLEKIALILVAKIRFRFTNAYILLNDIRESMSMSETMTPMEASLYAATRYVTDFMLAQADLVKG